MKMVPLQASARDTKVSVKNLRKVGTIPCVVYGNKVENTLLQCDEMALKRAYTQAGASTLIDLDIQGKKMPVLFHAFDLDPVSDRLTHVDFYAVDMNKELEASVQIRFAGEPIAVKELAAIFVTPVTRVTVKCLPADLPHELTVDVSGLAQFGDSVTLASIVVPKGVMLMEKPETVIATVQEPRAEEVVEVAAAPAEGEAAAAGAEGAPAAEGAAKEGEAAPAAEKKAEGKEKK